MPATRSTASCQRSCSGLPPAAPVARMCANGRPGGSTALPADAIPGQQTVADDSVLAPGGGHMRIRSTGLTLFAGLSILVAACSSGAASTAPSAAAPSTAAHPRRGAVGRGVDGAVRGRRRSPTSDLKIGVVTDVGTVNDKNFNEYTLRGRPAGRRLDRRHRRRPVVVPTAPCRLRAAPPGVRRPGLQHHRRRSASTWPPRPAKLAKANPDIWFIGVDHDAAASTRRATVDSDVRGLLGRPRRRCSRTTSRINYQEDQAGYLAGIVAASASKSGIIGAIGGVAICGPCVRYIQGYELGAKSVNPDIKVEVACVSDSDFVKALRRPGRRQDLRRAVHQAEPGHRRRVPGRRPDRQRRHRRRLRGRHQRHRRRRRPVPVLSGLAGRAS